MTNNSMDQKMAEMYQKILKLCQISTEQADAAKDGEIIKKCLFLSQFEYGKTKDYQFKLNLRFVVAKNLRTVENGMFCNCKKLELVFMPNLERIESPENDFVKGGFEGTGLQEICFPSLQFAGSRSFFSCQKLASVDLPACQKIGDYCFCYCTSIETLSFGAKIIGEAAFRDCHFLQYLKIPFAETIGPNLVAFDEQLEKIECNLKTEMFQCCDFCSVHRSCPVCSGDLENCFKRAKCDVLERLRLKQMELMKLLFGVLGKNRQVKWEIRVFNHFLAQDSVYNLMDGKE